MKVAVKLAVHKSCSALSHSCSFYCTLINIFIINQILKCVCRERGAERKERNENEVDEGEILWTKK